MNSTLYRSFQSTYSNPHKDLDESDSYFEEAKHGLLKDLVDFQNRDDFDQYMRQVEKNYYQKQNIAQPPYESLPQYPPKPFQDKKSTDSFLNFIFLGKSQHNQEQGKDFIDKVNEINHKRQQMFTPQQQMDHQKMMQQQDYYNSLTNRSINPYQNPFFEIAVNKENAHQLTYNPQYHQQLPAMHTPSIQGASIGYGHQPQFNHSNKFGQVMEPPMMHQPPPYLQKFVAGPTRLEANPLAEPLRTFKTLSPQKQVHQLQDYDLKNPDTQYERYKQLMQNQYYNNNANSMNLGINLTGAHTVYQPPPPFVQQQTPRSQQHQFQQKDAYNMSFNPNKPMYPHNNLQQPHIFPQANQIYNQNSVTLYQPPPHMMNHHGSSGFVTPQIYRQIKQNNIVDKNIIEAIGGIEDTLKPLEETLKQHELRPFQIQRDYRKEYVYSQKGKDLKRSYSEVRPEQMKIVSVSPYRAVVKIDKNAKQSSNNNYESSEETDEDEEALQRNEYQNQNHQLSERRNNFQNSPIRSDSQNLRGQREQYLNNFNQNRSYSSQGDYQEQQQNFGGPKEHQRIRKESEFLRQQREQFLSGFSGDNMKPPLHK